MLPCRHPAATGQSSTGLVLRPRCLAQTNVYATVLPTRHLEDIRNQFRFPQATQGTAGKCLSRTQRCRALQAGEGRYGSGKSCGVEADLDIRNQFRFPQATQGTAGKCLSRTQRCRALQAGEGRYGSGKSCGVEANPVGSKAIWSGT